MLSFLLINIINDSSCGTGKLIFDAGEGIIEGTSDHSIEYEEFPSSFPIVTRDGYEFIGWFDGTNWIIHIDADISTCPEDTTGETECISMKCLPDEEMTLTAVWEYAYDMVFVNLNSFFLFFCIIMYSY